MNSNVYTDKMKVEWWMNSKLLKTKREGKLVDSLQLRPIVSMMSSPVYNLSKYLASIISPNSSYSVKNIASFCIFFAAI